MAASAPVLACAGCLLLGGIAGGILGQVLFPGSAAPPATAPVPQPAAARSAEELELLRGLGAAVDRLAAALAASSTERRSLPPPLQGPAQGTAPETPQAPTAEQALARPPAGSESSLPAFEHAQEANRAALAPLYQQDYDARYLAHRYWTTEQVLKAYGVPDFLLPQDNGVVKWAYVDPVSEDWMQFDFYQGIVIRVDG